MKKIVLIFYFIISFYSYSDLFKEVQKSRDKKNFLIDNEISNKYSVEYLKFLTELKHSESLDEIISMTTSYYNYFQIKKENNDIDIEDINSLILISNVWFKLYEQIFSLSVNRSVDSVDKIISYTVFKEENTFINYYNWLATLDSKFEESYLKQYEKKDINIELEDKKNIVVSSFFVLEENKKAKAHQIKLIKKLVKKNFVHFNKEEYSEEWILAIEKYIKIQSFYSYTKEILKEHLTYISTDPSKYRDSVSMMKQYIRSNEEYFYLLDKEAKYQLFDKPLYLLIKHKYLLYAIAKGKGFTNPIYKREAVMGVIKMRALLDYCVDKQTKANYSELEKELKLITKVEEWQKLELKSPLKLSIMRILLKIEKMDS